MASGSDDTRRWMTRRYPARRDLGLAAQAAVMFGLGFAVVRCHQVSPGQTPRPHPPRSPAHRAGPPSSAPAPELARGEHPPPAVVRPGAAAALAPRAAREADTVRLSSLSDWAAFRVEHTTVALTIEGALAAALEERASLRELIRGCATGSDPASRETLDISAAIEIDARDVRVDGWGCDAEDPRGEAARMCDCVVDHLPEDLRVQVPADLDDSHLADHAGGVTLRL